MIARRQVRCIVVEVCTADRRAQRGALARDLLPWADPYVAGLIKKLQDEVRRERRAKSSTCRNRLTAVHWRDAVPNLEDDLDDAPFCR